MKKRRLDENLQTSPNVPARKPAPPPTDDKWSEFFGAVTASGLRPAVLSANPKYSSLYMPAVRTCSGADLRLLYDQRAQKLNYNELMQHAMLRRFFKIVRVAAFEKAATLTIFIVSLPISCREHKLPQISSSIHIFSPLRPRHGLNAPP